jgi:hypothetical protein
MRHGRGLLAMEAVLMCSACSSTTQVIDRTGSAALEVDGEDYGAVPPDGVAVRVDRGFSSVPYVLRSPTGVVVDEGEIARDEVAGWSWAIVIGSVGLAAACTPMCVAAGFTLANPGALIAPLMVVGTWSTGAVGTLLAAPSCATLPSMGVGALLGLSPLAALPLAAAPSAVVEVGIGAAAAELEGPPLPTITPATVRSDHDVHVVAQTF